MKINNPLMFILVQLIIIAILFTLEDNLQRAGVAHRTDFM